MIFPTTSPGGLAAFAALVSADKSCDDDTAATTDPVTAEARNPRRETVTSTPSVEGAFGHARPPALGEDRVSLKVSR
ncbi:hypothetical protein GCM10022419_099340 [Nonomuraea rosea]|uniref:Uncharacterized protein n=1 Tax=Nonomuraea rosea TaxID=638574 RepID=A0ABP6Z7M2_9ACTN